MKIIIITAIFVSASTSLFALDRSTLVPTPKVQRTPTTREVECSKLFLAAQQTGLPWVRNGNKLKLEVVGDSAIRRLFGNWSHEIDNSLPPTRYRGYIHEGIAREIFMDIVGGDIHQDGSRTYHMASFYEQTPYSIEVIIKATEDGRLLKMATLIVTEH